MRAQSENDQRIWRMSQLDWIEFMFDSDSVGAEVAQVMQAPRVAQVAGLPERCRDDGVSGGAVPAAVLPGGAVPAAVLPGGAVPAAVLPGEAVPDAVLPVLPALQGLLPGGLRRGSVVATGPWGLLCLALAAGASAAGAWCAVVGLPQLGVAAAAGAGLDPGRMLLIADPGPGWPQVVASLLDGCELVLLRPPDRPSAQMRRRLEATVRRFGGVLVVAGDWDGAQTRLLVAHQEWAGIGAGHGRLRARRAQVVADGRGAAARPLARWLWLPGPDGAVTIADEASASREPFWPEIRSTG
jgi:hypothetical protein